MMCPVECCGNPDSKIFEQFYILKENVIDKGGRKGVNIEFKTTDVGLALLNRDFTFAEVEFKAILNGPGSNRLGVTLV